MGCRNRPPFLRNQLLLKSIHSALGLLGLTDTVLVDLQDLDAGNGWILESRIYLEGGAEVAPLLLEPLLARILCSSRSHIFLRSVEIT